MYLTKEKKQELFEKHGRLKTKSDTGSAEAQIALFTYRINHLTDHLKTNKKDHSKNRTVKLVGKRRRLLDYFSRKDIERYRAIIKELKIRKYSKCEGVRQRIPSFVPFPTFSIIRHLEFYSFILCH
jgi:small subunit ribosomal protein S15